MNNDEFELLLADRLGVIITANEKYDLEHNAYLSFSGGKDSTVLHRLIDLALPGNRIPRVFINTGIEYNLIWAYVHSIATLDSRFEIVRPSKPIMRMLEEDGYPFKSKEHSMKIHDYRSGIRSPYIQKYMTGEHFACPKKLRYQFNDDFTLNISNKCCYRLKKEPAKLWEKENHRTIVMTGMQRSEGGQRANIKGCILTDKKGNVIKFHPLLVVNDEWEDMFIEKYKIKLCPLYYPPYNFKRTGCKGCPYALDLQRNLDIMEEFFPKEKAQCEMIWKPVYDEYRRIGYRLRKDEK